jgi:hypothetical protein
MARPMSHSTEKDRRRAAREPLGSYHEREPRALLEHVRDGFSRLDAGEIDAFELDQLIHRYKRSARELWTSRSVGPESTSAIEDARKRGEEVDWWAAGEVRRRR